ncbi:MAG: DUF4956 domain-containing protein [Deltaproteobacteria bacterium]|nr:DUF4956 domain-containing protein [Deltaproteobacteria bacterium]MCB9788202.1 DUF4956 domain-containing protein [Deltaproteobacteria bacterium]
MSEIFSAWTPGQALPIEVALFSLLLAFILSQAVAAAYIWTFRGMSYSRSFVQTVALGSVIAAMLMLAINNSIAAGLGIAGSLAIVRFRTAMRDPRDMVFVFASMGAGIASGLRAWAPAILGTVIFCLAAAALAFTDMGSLRVADGLLRFQAPADADTEEAVARILRRSTRSFALVTLRDVGQGTAMEHAYQVRLGTGASRSGIVDALASVPGVSDIQFLLQEPTVEL